MPHITDSHLLTFWMLVILHLPCVATGCWFNAPSLKQVQVSISREALLNTDTERCLDREPDPKLALPRMLYLLCREGPWLSWRAPVWQADGPRFSLQLKGSGGRRCDSPLPGALESCCQADQTMLTLRASDWTW